MVPQSVAKFGTLMAESTRFYAKILQGLRGLDFWTIPLIAVRSFTPSSDVYGINESLRGNSAPSELL